VNRRLIRPSLSEVQDQIRGPQTGPRRKPVPPEQTHAEAYYYVKQMQARTPMVIVLTDGETLRGIIEWYDRDCIKLTRSSAPNLLLYKASIKYLYKDENGSNGLQQDEPEMAHAGRDGE